MGEASREISENIQANQQKLTFCAGDRFRSFEQDSRRVSFNVAHYPWPQTADGSPKQYGHRDLRSLAVGVLYDSQLTIS